MTWRARARLARSLAPWSLAVALSLGGCGGATTGPTDPVTAAREAAAGSSDPRVLGRWVLAELVAPGGTPAQARTARERLDRAAPDGRELFASLARAIDDEAHGKLGAAARHYLAAVDAARVDEGPEAPLLAWFATNRLVRLRPSVADLWRDAAPIVERAIEAPGRIGYRARGDLADWWAYEARREAKRPRAEIDERLASRLGCVASARFAGPFGRPAPSDVVESFAAERPTPWPATFAADPRRLDAARTVAAERTGCTLRAAEPLGEGIAYVETFVELPHGTDVIVVVQGAAALRVDDVEVLDRDPRRFGVWPRFGVALRLAAGRHRIVARLGSAETSIRVVDAAGRPIPGVRASADPGPAYAVEPPIVLPEPNVLAPFLRAAGVPDEAGWPLPSTAYARLDVDDPFLRLVAADLALVEGQGDLASVLLEPLVADGERVTALVLAQIASVVEEDPVFAPNDARDLALDHRRRAVERDPGLWFPALWIALDAADKQGPREALAELEALSARFPEAPALSKALASHYARLGYAPERRRTIVDAARRFPDDPDVLRALLAIHDEEGRFEDADRVAAHLASVEPNAPLAAERALARGDLLGAAAALERYAADAGDPGGRVARRAAELLARAGRRPETIAALERALADEPTSPVARLAVADARLAGGEAGALRRALVDAIQRGAETDELRAAIELVEGMIELEAYRKDTRAAIASYEASEASHADAARPGVGNAARVLDYAAIWIHRDGSARMLEHEILHLRTREAIAEHAEQRLPRGRVLRVRTVKKDGRTFEPEIVSGKPTVTMPHLEVGDYVETETLYDLPGDRRGGRAFVGPRWFFREEKVDYHLSEFVVVSPTDRSLDVETTGAVPAPEVRVDGPITTRRWRVEQSPALPEEPFSAKVAEFLPSVRVGWGITQDEVLTRLVEATKSLVPPDPRLVRIARTIATDGAPPSAQPALLARLDPDTKARRIYRWVLENVEAGREGDPRRAVVGKSGSRIEAFAYLARLVGVEVDKGVVQDRLAPPPRGPIDAAQLMSEAAVAVPRGDGSHRWMVVGDRYTPYGYLPSSLRGQPAVVLRDALVRTTTDAGGPPDRVSHRGTAKVDATGSATIELATTFEGRLAIDLRGGIERLDAERLEEAIEAKLLPQLVPGARLLSLEVRALDDLDAPLVLVMKLEVSSFARRQADSLVITPPFPVRLGPLASLPERQTPLLLVGGFATDTEVDLTLELPSGATLPALPAGTTVEDGPRRFVVADAVEGGKLRLRRSTSLPAGRIEPVAYPAFVSFARSLDEQFRRDVVLGMR